jgi:hypothetical protein
MKFHRSSRLSSNIKIEVLESRIAPAFASTFDLSSLNGFRGYSVGGQAVGDEAGFSVKDAGDVNGDGLSDIVVGAPFATGDASDSGVAYVLFGSAGGLASDFGLDDLDGTNGFKINGSAANDMFGSAVSGAGDVNGDGKADIIIGASGADPGGASSGATYVIFGGSSFGATLSVSALDGTNGFRVDGGNADDLSGRVVSSAGDFNDDGFDDIVIGASGDDGGNTDAGAAYVVFGSLSFPASISLSSLSGGMKVAGASAFDFLGGSVSSAGDVNNDGYDDIIIGAEGADANGADSGRAYVIFGSEVPPSPISVAGLSLIDGFAIHGAAAASRAGYSVAGLGDFNGDSFDDVVIGAPNSLVSGVAGASYVVFGSSSFSGSVELSSLNGTNGFKIESASGTELFGTKVARAGDVNADGIPDLIAGAYAAATPNGNGSGASYVIYGSTSAFPNVVGLSGLDGSNGFKIFGIAAGDSSGRGVSAAGDVNGDGVADLIIGGNLSAFNGASSGQFSVVFGQPKTDIDVELVTGELIIADTAGARSEAAIQVTRVGANVEISAPGLIVQAKGAVTQVNLNTVSIPFSSISGRVIVSGGIGDDDLTINTVAGSVSNGFITYSGGEGGDSLVLSGAPESALSILASTEGHVLGSAAHSVNVDEVESVLDNRAFANVDFEISDGVDFSLDVSASSESGLTTVFAQSGMVLATEFIFSNASDSLSVTGGDGDDTIIVNTLRVPSLSTFSVIGGNGLDSITTSAPLDVAGLTMTAESVLPLGSLTLGLSGAAISSATQAVTFQSNATLRISVAGSDAGIIAGALVVNGAVNLNNVVLSVSATLGGVANAPLKLVDNDGADPVVGTFLNLPEGATVSFSGSSYAISYVGGDGNDVVLSRRLPYASTKLSTLDGANGFMIPGLEDEHRLPTAISGLGDVNGDGVDDFIVSSQFIGFPNETLNPNSGSSWVVFGTGETFPSDFDLGSLSGADGFVIRPALSGEASGMSVSGNGDVNGDGIADIVIGARNAARGGNVTGAVYVVFGKSSPFSAEIELATLGTGEGFRIDGVAGGDLFGSSVHSGGDVNGDGISDIVIGAPGAGVSGNGSVYAVFGRGTSFPAVIAASSLTGSDGFVVSGDPDVSGAFGTSVSTSDINGDGISDIVAGAPNFGVNGQPLLFKSGAVYVVFGTEFSAAASSSVTSLNGRNGFRISGLEAFQSLGLSVAGAGDLNADGIEDIIIGAPGDPLSSISTTPGSAYVIFGKSAKWSAEFDLLKLSGVNGFTVSGIATGDLAGFSVAGAGDYNGDQIDDVIVGSPSSDENGFSAGAAHVIFGRPGGFAPSISLASINGTVGFTFIGETAGDRAGALVSGAGDVNNDGRADIIIGAPSFKLSGSDIGQAYVVFGKEAFHPLPTISKSGAVAKFLDVDGDEITVSVSKGRINAAMFTFSPDGDLLLVDLGAGGTLKKGANITFGVKQTSGNGTLDVGAIVGNSMQLGKITITGDLGQIDLSPLDPEKAVIKQLIVGSFGMMGDTNQIPGTVEPLMSDIEGSIGRIVVKRNIQFATLNILGSLGNITIGGDFNGTGALDEVQLAALGQSIANVAGGGTLASSGLNAGSIGKLNVKGGINSAAVKSGGNIGSATVGGSVNKGAIVAAGAIRIINIFDSITSDDPDEPSVIAALGKLNPKSAGASVAINVFTVRNDVRNAEVLIGYDASFSAINPDASIGRITVKRDWVASSLAVGVDDSGDDGFGINDALIPDIVADKIIARIASLTIVGNAVGSENGAASFAITAQQIAKAKISGTKLVLDKLLADDVLVEGTTNFRIREVVAI